MIVTKIKDHFNFFLSGPSSPLGSLNYKTSFNPLGCIKNQFFLLAILEDKLDSILAFFTDIFHWFSKKSQ